MITIMYIIDLSPFSQLQFRMAEIQQRLIELKGHISAQQNLQNKHSQLQEPKQRRNSSLTHEGEAGDGDKSGTIELQ